MNFFRFLATLFIKKRSRLEMAFDSSESNIIGAMNPNPTIRPSITPSDIITIECHFKEEVNVSDIETLVNSGKQPFKFAVVETNEGTERQVFADTLQSVIHSISVENRRCVVDITGIPYWHNNFYFLVCDDMEDTGSSSSDPEYYKWEGDTIHVNGLEWTRQSLSYNPSDHGLYYGENNDQLLMTVADDTGITYQFDGENGTKVPATDNAGRPVAYFSYDAFRRLFAGKTLPNGWRIPKVHEVYSLHKFVLHDHSRNGDPLISPNAYQTYRGYYERKKWAEALNAKGAAGVRVEDLGSTGFVDGSLSANRLVENWPEEISSSSPDYPKWAYAEMDYGLQLPMFPVIGNGEEKTGKRLFIWNEMIPGRGEPYHARDELGLSIGRSREYTRSTWGQVSYFWYSQGASIWLDPGTREQLLSVIDDTTINIDNSGSIVGVARDAAHLLFNKVRPRPTHHVEIDGVDHLIRDYPKELDCIPNFFNSFAVNGDFTTTIRCYDREDTSAYFWHIDEEGVYDYIKVFVTNRREYFSESDPEDTPATSKELYENSFQIRLVR